MLLVKKIPQSRHNDIPNRISPSGQEQFISISIPSPVRPDHGLLWVVKHVRGTILGIQLVQYGCISILLNSYG